MALSNVTVTKSWSKILNSVDDEFTLTLPFNSMAVVEVVPMATSTAPSGVVGVSLIPSIREGLTRSLTGPGYLYARIVQVDPASSETLVLMNWSA